MKGSASKMPDTEEVSLPVPPPPSERQPGDFLPPFLYNFLNKLGLIELVLVHKWNFFYGLVGFTSLYLVQEYFMTITCNLVGFILPAIKSVKAIETPCKDDDTEWLMYWVVFAFFSVVEFFADLTMSWFPFYLLGKCLFLLWCMSPVSWNGSAFLYKNFIRRFILSHESEIDRVFNRVNAGAKDILSTASEAAKSSTAGAMEKVALSMMTLRHNDPPAVHTDQPEEEAAEVPQSTHSLKKDHSKSKSSIKSKESSGHVSASPSSVSKKDD